MEHRAQVKFDDILSGYGWVCASSDGANSAFVSRATGMVHWASSDTELDDEPPEDVEDGSIYVGIPHKLDLNLGKDLALAFTEERLGDSIRIVQGFFRQRGAYGRFKDLLEHSGLLQAWYDYEASKTEVALREWCAEQGIAVAPGSGNSAG